MGEALGREKTALELDEEPENDFALPHLQQAHALPLDVKKQMWERSKERNGEFYILEEWKEELVPDVIAEEGWKADELRTTTHKGKAVDSAKRHRRRGRKSHSTSHSPQRQELLGN